jgi:hypothetical protein
MSYSTKSINSLTVCFFIYMCNTSDLGSKNIKCVCLRKSAKNYQPKRGEDGENYIMMCFIMYNLHITLVTVIKLIIMKSQALKRVQGSGLT